MWEEFGFNGNPYETNPVRGDEKGERLLVGRPKELKRVKNRLGNFGNVVTIEGPNGVGKTSLVLVAGYQAEVSTRQKGKKSLILLPQPFQLSAEESAVEFKRKVYAEIASHFIKNEKRLRERLGLQFNLKPLEAWLENPLFRNASGNVAGFGGGLGSSPNQSSGFDIHGFFNIVDRLLSAAFREGGGVICILDNLEILDTSRNARLRLEEFRDDLFSKHGLKWVVCGARGIVKSVASSARLQGRFQEPLEILPLTDECIPDLIEARVKEYSNSHESIPPLALGHFNMFSAY